MNQELDVAAHLAAIVECSDDAIISKDLEGKILTWNRGAERLFGYTSAEAVGNSIHIIIPEHLRREEDDIVARLRRGERIEHYETTRVTRDGTLVLVSLSASLLRDSDGNIIGAAKIARDISSRVRTREALMRSERELRLVIDSLPALVSYVDKDLRYRRMNQSYQEWFNRPLDQMLGRHVSELLDDNYEALLPYMQLALRGETVQFEGLSKYTDKVRSTLVNYTPDIGPDGTVHGFVALVTDITEQKRVEYELRKRDHFVALAQPVAKAGFFRYLPERDVLEVTEGTIELFGLPQRERYRLHDIRSRIFADDVQALQTALRNAEVSGELFGEFRVPHDSGQVRWIALQARLLREPGEEPYFMGINLDVTRRKRAEEELRRSEKLVAAGRLAASIAHEINNPLEAITNLLFLAQNELHTGDNVREYLQMAEEQLLRVAQISKQTLGFYRDSTHPVAVDLCSAAKEVLQLFAPKLEQNGVRLVPRLHCTSMIEAHAGEMRQVITNLLSNALDATEPGCSIYFCVRDSTCWYNPEVSGVRITVLDTGHGMPESVLRATQEPFFTTKGSKGTGLGLWVIRGIVDKHGGSMSVRSSVRPGHTGTVFSIFIPTKLMLNPASASEKLHRVVGRDLMKATS
ncbi:MAG TPA: PAS domain S-box protein [Terriglobales bacterium]|jgi:PAS domain S-box-containing protein